MSDRNQTTYKAADVVRYYAQLQQLQPAETTILKLLQDQLATMTMLDIGVGAGRTTQHFSPHTAEYLGIDYSSDMIAACQKRFPNADQSISFQVSDARDMTEFADDSCDFILFSYNGIDSISHEDRLIFFQEIQRIGRSDGYFCFSSHNLTALESQFDYCKQFNFNPFQAYVNLFMTALLHLFNFPIGLKKLQSVNHEMLRDESHNFRLKQYYIRPNEQLNQLKTHFRDVQIYSWKSGLELTNATEVDACSDLWLYYLCRINPVVEGLT